jgi:multidrug efflux pump subunit AcrB
MRVLNESAAEVRDVSGVQDVLALPEHPFDLSPLRVCMLVRLAPAAGRNADQQQIADAIRRKLGVHEEQVARLRDLSGASRFPRCGYPIDLAVYDKDDKGIQAQWDLADRIVARLAKSPQLTDVSANRESALKPRIDVTVDHEKATALDVKPADIMTAIKDVGALDSLSLSDHLKQVQVANSKGERVPLSEVVIVKPTARPDAVYRCSMYPMVEITANLATGVSLGEALTLVENAVRQELGATDGMMWLQDMPAKR